MRADDIMRRRVLTVSPDTDIHEVAKKLADYGISAMPVVDAERHIVGMISEGDLMRLPETGTERRPSWWLRFLADNKEQAAQYIKTHGHHAKDVMTRKVVTVSEETSIQDIAKILEEHRIKRVPVVRDGKLVGIVSRANLLHGLILQKPIQGPVPTDRDIKKFILSGAQEAGIRGEFIDVVVSEGVAHLWGAVYSDEEKDALRIAAENTQGVSSVVDHTSVMPEIVQAAVGIE
jgi:CBS domain-containing protein